jgi:hypothetical protein
MTQIAGCEQLFSRLGVVDLRQQCGLAVLATQDFDA